MSEPLLDFQCYVGKYEIWRSDELPPPLEQYPRVEPHNMPYLVEIGSAKLVTPPRKRLEAAVGWLLQTPIAKWEKAFGRWANKLYELDQQFEHDVALEKCGEIDLDPEEFSNFKRNVLLISHHLGLLGGRGDKHGVKEIEADPDYPIHQSLDRWVLLALLIQSMFLGRGPRSAKNEKEVGNLSLYLSYEAGAPTIQMRPRDLHDALIYCAALMIARGTTAQTCNKCGTPFLEGGERTGKKRRSGSRFCSDKCRYEYHNELRRKVRATKS